MFSRWLKWPLFAAFTGLVLVACVSAEMQEAKIYNQRQPAKAESGNSETGKAVGSIATKPQNEIREGESQWYGELLKPTDWLLVIFNGFLVLYTRRLYNATSGLFVETAGLRTAADKQSTDMQASIRAAVDSAKSAITANQIAVTNTQQQLRAYVTALDVHVIQHRQPGRMSAYNTEIPGPVHTYEFAVILKNGGETPAINVRTNISLKRFEGEPPANFDFPSSNLFGYGLIGPQTELRTRYQVASAGLIDDVGPIILVWGWVEYDDIFVRKDGIKNRTEFCYRMDRRRLPVTNELWMGFIPYERFNAIDWYCLRAFDPATGEGGG